MSTENNLLYWRIYGHVLTILDFLLFFSTQNLQFCSFWTLCNNMYFSLLQSSQNSFTRSKAFLFGAACLVIQTTVDVLSILNWIETLCMSLQYIFNANETAFIFSTFIWLFDSSTLQCQPDEMPIIYCTPTS